MYFVGLQKNIFQRASRKERYPRSPISNRSARRTSIPDTPTFSMAMGKWQTSSNKSAGVRCGRAPAQKSPEFRKEWGHFDQLTDEIDAHLYEVTHVMDSSQ